MSEKLLSVNIDADAVIEQYEKEHVLFAKTKTEFDKRNYLQARLLPGETSKTLTIRLLPFESNGGTPFKKVFIHTVKVNKEMSPGGWKTFICPIHNEMGDRCPFCETSAKAKELKNVAENQAEREKYSEIEFMNRAKAAWIVRCIERGHEEDGVKFWLFNDSMKKDGVYDKIYNIYKQRKESAERKGKTSNIFDVNDGKDLIITLSKDSNNKTVTKIVDDDDKSPLTTDYEQGMAWINDQKKWDSVYTVKPYEYMAIALQDGVPYWDKEQGKYINRSEFIEAEKARQESELANNITPQTFDPNADNSLIEGAKIVDVPF